MKIHWNIATLFLCISLSALLPLGRENSAALPRDSIVIEQSANMTEVIIAFITTPSTTVARNIAKSLLQSRLIACANILPGVQSLYMWEGEVNDDSEVLMMVKTQKKLIKDVSNAIKNLHPYEVPEVVAVPSTGGHEPYIQWVLDTTSRATNPTDE